MLSTMSTLRLCKHIVKSFLHFSVKNIPNLLFLTKERRVWKNKSNLGIARLSKKINFATENKRIDDSKETRKSTLCTLTRSFEKNSFHRAHTIKATHNTNYSYYIRIS